MFYVGDWKIYDRFGGVIADLEPRPSIFGPHVEDFNTEYPIVPCIEENTACGKSYYVFYTSCSNSSSGSTGNMQLFAKLVTIDNVTGNIQATDIKDALGNRRVLATSIPFNYQGTTTSNYGNSGLAISKLTGNKRYLYWVAGYVAKITLSSLTGNGNGNGISEASNIFSLTQNASFEFATLEADLSHLGDRLIWGTAKNSTNIQKYFMIGLNPTNGNWDFSINEIFSLPTSENNQIRLRGVEFASDGLSIYVTTGGTQGNHGIYRKSLTPLSSAFQFIPNSNSYGKSQLELGRNGLIYAVSSTINAIDGINLTTNTFSLPARINTPTTLAFGGYYALPDQIDGELYDNTPMDFYDIKDLAMPENPAYNLAVQYSQTANPFNTSGNPIKIAGTWSFIGITKPEGSESIYILDKINFLMAKDAKIIVGDGMKLLVYGCTFQSADCVEMWDGFQVVGTGQLHIVDPPLGTQKRNEIYDAKIAAEAKGGQARLHVRHAIFNRNTTHIKITDYRYYNMDGEDIADCDFLHTQPLKLSGVPRYGSNSIELDGNIVSTIPLLIGNNTFEGGLYGIFSRGVPFRVVDHNKFKNFIKSNNDPICIYVDMKGRNATVEIDHAVFTTINQALYARGQANVTFTNNILTGTENHAVKLYQNKDRTLTFHHNTYNQFKQSCILLDNNAGTPGLFSNNTIIDIHHENFVSSPVFIKALPLSQQCKPTAITLMEPGVSKTAGVNYKMLRIHENTMTDVAWGVRAYNIVGFQKMNKRYNDDYTTRTDVSDIDKNTIKVYANYVTVPDTSHYNSGMLLGNSSGLVAAVNDITSNQKAQWRSAGIYSNNTQQTLLYKNVLKAGRSIRGDYFGIGNDFKCNTLIRGVNGVSLQDYRMRNAGQTHGVNLVESRDNTYLTAKENIELYLYRVPSTPLNIASYVNANQWFMNTSPTTLIEPTPTCFPYVNCIKRTGAPDLCNLLPDNGGGGTIIRYDAPNTQPYNPDNMLYNWQHHYEYERQQKENGSVFNTTISKIIDIEELVTNGEDAVALGILIGMQSNLVYEQNYIELYKRLIPARLERNGVLDSPEVAYFKSIASQDPYTAGPSIFLARAILWQQEGLHYIDMDNRNSGNIEIQLSAEECIGQIPEDFKIQLMNEDGYVYPNEDVPLQVDEEGYVFIPNDIVSTLPQDFSYTFVFDDGNYPSPPLQTLADWMDGDNNTIYLCNNSLLGNAKNKQEPTTQIEQRTQANPNYSGVTIFPNPARDAVTVMLPSKEEYTIAVYDIMGRKVYAQKHAQKVVLPTDNYNPGVYLIKVSDITGNLVETKRVIIKP